MGNTVKIANECFQHFVNQSSLAESGNNRRPHPMNQHCFKLCIQNKNVLSYHFIFLVDHCFKWPWTSRLRYMP